MTASTEAVFDLAMSNPEDPRRIVDLALERARRNAHRPPPLSQHWQRGRHWLADLSGAQLPPLARRRRRFWSMTVLGLLLLFSLAWWERGIQSPPPPDNPPDKQDKPHLVNSDVSAIAQYSAPPINPAHLVATVHGSDIDRPRLSS